MIINESTLNLLLWLEQDKAGLGAKAHRLAENLLHFEGHLTPEFALNTTSLMEPDGRALWDTVLALAGWIA